MVSLPNKDRILFDLPYKVADIIKEYQKNGNVLIDTNSEGICLRAAGLYDLLDYICESYQIDKQNIKILTPNAEETHEHYDIKIQGNHWIDKCKNQFDKKIEKTNNLKTIGCFLGKPNWHRLILASWIHNKPNILLTCHYDPTSERHQIDSELTEININASEELHNVLNFLPKCPIVLKDGFLDYTIQDPIHYNILDYYPTIFLDLVVETYITGLTFFPTEKTFRPIIAKTPFIIMGPCGYLGNLKRMGFKTFSNWWDESYDEFSNFERLKKIKIVIDEISKYSMEKTAKLYDEMHAVLEHNRNHLKNLHSNSTLLAGNY